MHRRNLLAIATFGFAALLLPTAAFASFRSYPAIYCAQIDDSAYKDPSNNLTLDTGGRGAVRWIGGPTTSQSILCPIFNDDRLNVRTHTPIHTYVSATSNVVASACVTWAGGNGGYCGTSYTSMATGLLEIVDEGAYTGTHSTSANDTFFLLVRLMGQVSELVSYYFTY